MLFRSRTVASSDAARPQPIVSSSKSLACSIAAGAGSGAAVTARASAAIVLSRVSCFAMRSRLPRRVDEAIVAPPFEEQRGPVILLTNEDVEPLIKMPECIAAIEAAFADLGKQDAVDIPRQDAIVPNARPGAIHDLKTMSGSWQIGRAHV